MPITNEQYEEYQKLLVEKDADLSKEINAFMVDYAVKAGETLDELIAALAEYRDTLPDTNPAFPGSSSRSQLESMYNQLNNLKYQLVQVRQYSQPAVPVIVPPVA